MALGGAQKGGDPLTMRGQSSHQSRSLLPTQPYMSAPMIGAAQKSQSWESAHPPTNSAGPVLRAEFTGVLVTGMPIREISVRHGPIGMGAKLAAARPSVAPRTTMGNIAVIPMSQTKAGAVAAAAGNRAGARITGWSEQIPWNIPMNFARGYWEPV
jgi:hypothetical protein